MKFFVRLNDPTWTDEDWEIFEATYQGYDSKDAVQDFANKHGLRSDQKILVCQASDTISEFQVSRREIVYDVKPVEKGT